MELSFFPRDVFADLERLQQQMQQAFEYSPSIRGFPRRGFPALNVGRTEQSVEIYAFAPGLEPSSLEVNLERGVLTIDGERASDLPQDDGKTIVHIDERFAGRFRRVVTLSEDLDPNSVQAKYRDGVLHISIRRHEAAQSRRIAVQ